MHALPLFLAHKFPVVRSDTAEKLYILLQGVDVGRDTDEIEDILLSTEWYADASCSAVCIPDELWRIRSNESLEVAKYSSSRVVELLLAE